MSDEAQDTRVVDLALTSWPRLLFALLSQRFTGAVWVEQPGDDAQRRTVTVWGGFPVWTDWALEGTRVGELLVAAGALDEAAVTAAVTAAKAASMRLGEYLLEQGTVSQEQVADALREQCERRIEAMFVMRDGQLTLSGDPGMSEDDAAALTQSGVLGVIQRGVCHYYDPDRIDAEMAGLSGAHLRITSSFEKYGERFGLSATELGSLQRLASLERIDVSELAATTDVDWVRTLQLLYMLWACQMLVPAEDTSNPIKVDVSKVDALVGALQERIASGAGAHEVLGIDKDADLRSIDAAWQRLASQLDPVALGPEASEAMVSHVQQVRTALDEVRSASRARREALAEMSAGRLVREQKFVKALPLLEDLVALRPADVLARASLAWCRYQQSKREQRDATKALKVFDEAIRQDGSFAQIHYYKGYVLRDTGNGPMALVAFDQALALDPDNVDAERQARAIRSGVPPAKDRAAEKVEFKPKGPQKHRHALWSGPWPAIWILTGLLIIGLGAAQVVLRMDF